MYTLKRVYRDRLTSPFFTFTALTLLAFAIIFPARLQIGAISADDIPALFAATVLLIYVVRTCRLPTGRILLISIFLFWALAGLFSIMVNAYSSAFIVEAVPKGVVRPLVNLAVVITSAALINSRERISVAMWLITISGAVMGVLAIYSYTTGFTGPLGIGLVPSIEGIRNTNAGRFQGTAMHINAMGAFFVLVMPTTLALAMLAKKRSRLLILLAIFTVQGFGILITLTRGAWISLAFALIISVLLSRVWRKYLLLFPLLAIPAMLLPEVNERVSVDGLNTGRLYLWGIGMKMFQDNMFFGVGVDQYMNVVNDNFAQYPTTFVPHNAYISFGAEQGIFVLTAVVLAVLYYGTVALITHRQSVLRFDRIVTSAILGGYFGFVLQNATNTLFYLPQIAVYFWMGLGIAISIKNIQNNERLGIAQ
jgi:O-antigen ligase